MISWDKICQPKKMGGLGLRKMAAVNSAFLSKLTWKLFQGHSLWVDQMKAKYSINEFFSKLAVLKVILGHGNVFFVTVLNSGKAFDGRWVMKQKFILGLIIGVQMTILLPCLTYQIHLKLTPPFWYRISLLQGKNGMF